MSRLSAAPTTKLQKRSLTGQSIVHSLRTGYIRIYIKTASFSNGCIEAVIEQVH